MNWACCLDVRARCWRWRPMCTLCCACWNRSYLRWRGWRLWTCTFTPRTARSMSASSPSKLRITSAAETASGVTRARLSWAMWRRSSSDWLESRNKKGTASCWFCFVTGKLAIEPLDLWVLHVTSASVHSLPGSVQSLSFAAASVWWRCNGEPLTPMTVDCAFYCQELQHDCLSSSCLTLFDIGSWLKSVFTILQC